MSGLILDLFGFPMGSPIPYRISSELPARPPVTAGTDEPEGVAVEAVAADPAVRDTDAASDDGGSVEHIHTVGAALADRQGVPAGLLDTAPGKAAQESLRLARLARFQRQP